jgi:hypothetical protein
VADRPTRRCRLPGRTAVPESRYKWLPLLDCMGDSNAWRVKSSRLVFSPFLMDTDAERIRFSSQSVLEQDSRFVSRRFDCGDASGQARQ